jgi:hypothetical protein
LSSLTANLARPHDVTEAPVSDAAAWDRAGTASNVFVVVGQIPGLHGDPRPPAIDPRFRLTDQRFFDGFAPVAVFTYAVRQPRSGK